MDLVKREWLESVRQVFVSLFGIIPYVGVAKNMFSLTIIYHIHLIENTGFLEDLFCKTKALRAFQGGRISDIIILRMSRHPLLVSGRLQTRIL